jgi:hypothetical protein
MSVSLMAMTAGEQVPTTFGLRPIGHEALGAPSALALDVIIRGWATVPPESADPIADRLFHLKVATAEIAMHLEGAWRSGLFRQLDDLLDEDSWRIGDTLPSPESYRTFLRLVVGLGRPIRPSLGCDDDGNIIAAWGRGSDRLTIECRQGDKVRWVLTRRLGDDLESAAGTCKLENLLSRLDPYEPGTWFHADDKHSGRRRPAAPREGEPASEGPGHA